MAMLDTLSDATFKVYVSRDDQIETSVRPGWGRKRFAAFWIFQPIFHRFTLNFANMPFQVLKAWNIVYKIWNLKIRRGAALHPT